MIGIRRQLAMVAAAGIIVLTLSGAACTSKVSTQLIQELRNVAAELVADAAARETTTVVGLDGWLFFVPELRHLSVGQFWGERAADVTQARNADAADPLPAILDFKRQLDTLGVELLLVPVPLKSIIYPDRLHDDLDIPMPAPRLDGAHQEFYALLRGNGVDVLDLTEPFLQDRFYSDDPLYCRRDTHWSGVGCVHASLLIAQAIRERPWFADIPTTSYMAGWETVSITGDLTADLAVSPAAEELRLRRVVHRDPTGRPVEVAPDPASPIVLLGDSHNLVFHAGGDMHTSGAGLADQLAYELGIAVDLVAVRGAGSTAARVNLLRRAQRSSEYWAGKRLVVWCFSAREFTESDGWSLVPIRP